MADTQSPATQSPAVLAVVSADAIDPSILDDFVSGPANGAIVTFQGVVRDHDGGRAVSALDYQAHPSAEEFLRDCCARVAEATGLRVAASHRTGHLAIGDLALVAAVGAPHRAEAFAACAELVELIKAGIPIWKRQHFVDGVSEWVGLE
jgi:molybdopterin synthase catalytic subunit